jgi:proteasome lid subunit RPN8/RPN11
VVDNSEFQIVERRFDAPFRKRSLHAGCDTFRAADLQVYMLPGVTARLRQQAAQARPRETGGLLAGRILRDDEGRYVVLTGMAVAPPDAGDVGQFNLSPAETETLRRTLSAQDPSADIVGWWHSHSRPSHYSTTDRRNQAVWADPCHVGLLVFAEGTPWANLYVGPQCQGPFPPERPPASRAGQPTPGRGRVKPQPAADGPAQAVRPGPDGRIPRRLVPPAVLALIVLLAGALAISLLTNGPATIRTRNVVHPGISCVISVTNYATCHVPTSAPVKWYKNGHYVSSGNRIGFYLDAVGNTVQAVVGPHHGGYRLTQSLTSSGVREKG